MLAIALALGASLAWGTSDFLGGLKSRKTPLLSVLLTSQVTALALLTVIVVVRGASPPDAASLGCAAAAGLGEVVGVAALYRGLAVGKMSIVAPVAATAPMVPLVAGLATGEIPGPIQWAGLALALIGLIITSGRPGGDQASSSLSLPSMLYGLLAAFGFGTFFFAMDSASEGDVGWALLTARLAAVAAIATVVILKRHRPTVPMTDLPVIAGIGVLIITGDFLYAAASTLGLVGIVAVLGSLHTIITIALARILLNEQLKRAQQAGIATSLIGVLAISLT
ncbi:DMT family transporter [Nonomuraea sp. NPDC049152]|uniref:DMT family transporter n=1 Tax=Nonomuraea sp. NPDC049152 TaxID=3154350 RepID=UPI0033E168EC